MNSAMIDLETLSLDPDACVVSIGVAIFNDEQVIEVKSWELDMKYVNGHIDPSTVAWWMHPDRDAARQATFGGSHSIFTAGYELKTLLATHNVEEVWANDPEFDLVVLKRWWMRNSEKGQLGDWPINYKWSRSFRTVMAEAQRLGHDTNQLRGFYIAHDAGEDAASQARAVIGARRMIRSGEAK